MAYTDLFNVTLDNLAATLQTITGLRVVTEPRAINPPCVFIDVPSFDAGNSNIVKMVFPVHVVGTGPTDLNGLRVLLNIASKLLNKDIAVTDGRPSSLTIGGQDFATYDLQISIQGQSS
jgi:hypothetical protein